MAEESPYSGSRKGPNRGPHGGSHGGASGSDRRQPDQRQIAVAIENRPGDPQGQGRAAPRVVASGRGALAEQILQIAFDRGVKVRQDADLAEILATIDIESEIPLEALAAVAEILSYVYRNQSKIAPGQGAAESGA